ncbi:hypothetical protein BH11CYA1_BH11CYA1_17330 [soil metagenome]
MIPSANCTYRRIVTNKAPAFGLLLLALLQSLLIVSPFSCQPAAADSLSLPDQLSQLERSQGISPNPGQSIIDRLQTLELKTFGNSGNGSIFERLNRLTSRQILPAANTVIAEPDSAKQQRLNALMQSANLTRSMITANTYPTHFFRIEEANSEPSSEDYLASVLTASKNRVFKFEAMPVPVYITATSDAGYSNAVMAAFGDWDRRSEGMIRFVPVAQANAARIRVTWSHLGLKSDKDSNLGAHTMTKWTKKPSGRLSLLSVGAIPVPLYIPSAGPKYTVPPQVIEVNLDLVESNEADSRYITLRNIVAHELGHAIGLLGHSPAKGDLMYPVTDEHSRISQRDLNTVRRLYEKKTTVPL